MRNITNRGEWTLNRVNTGRSGLTNPLHKIPSTLRYSHGLISPERYTIVRVLTAPFRESTTPILSGLL